MKRSVRAPPRSAMRYCPRSSVMFLRSTAPDESSSMTTAPAIGCRLALSRTAPRKLWAAIERPTVTISSAMATEILAKRCERVISLSESLDDGRAMVFSLSPIMPADAVLIAPQAESHRHASVTVAHRMRERLRGARRATDGIDSGRVDARHQSHASSYCRLVHRHNVI